MLCLPGSADRGLRPQSSSREWPVRGSAGRPQAPPRAVMRPGCWASVSDTGALQHSPSMRRNAKQARTGRIVRQPLHVTLEHRSVTTTRRPAADQLRARSSRTLAAVHLARARFFERRQSTALPLSGWYDRCQGMRVIEPPHQGSTRWTCQRSGWAGCRLGAEETMTRRAARSAGRTAGSGQVPAPLRFSPPSPWGSRRARSAPLPRSRGSVRPRS
jgi:hypothetical protein